MSASYLVLAVAASLLGAWRLYKYLYPGPLKWASGLDNKAVARQCVSIFRAYGVQAETTGHPVFDISIDRQLFKDRLPTLLIACRDRSFFGTPEIAFRGFADDQRRTYVGVRFLVLTPSVITREIAWCSEQYAVPVLHTSDIPDFARALRLAQSDGWTGYNGESQVFASLLKPNEARPAAPPPDPQPAIQAGQADDRLETLQKLRKAAGEAEQNGNLREACENWSAMRQAAPGDAYIYFHEARLLTQLQQHDEAEAVLAEAVSRFPKQEGLLAAYAKSAMQLGNTPESIARWQTVVQTFPGSGGAHVQYAIALDAAGRLEEADSALMAALPSIADPWNILVQHARNATQRDARDEAVKRWRRVVDTFPDKPAAYAGLADALRVNRQAAEAIRSVEAGLARLPDTYELLVEQSRNLTAAGRMDEALGIWARMRASHPSKVAAFKEPAALLRMALRLDECEALIAEGLQHFPADPGLLTERASVLAKRQNWQGAFDIFSAILADRPDQRHALIGAAEALLELGRPTEALPILDQLLTQSPGHREFLLVRAKADMALGLWPQAIARLEHVSRIDPRNPVIPKLLYQARLNALETEPASDAQNEPQAERAVVVARQAAKDDPDKILMTGFESLGADCEFGLVQRYYATEPLGLLRWASINVDELTRALRAQFAGVGEAENTTLDAGGSEYVTRDRNYRMTMHSWIDCNTIEPEQVLPKLLTRIKFLTWNLIEELQAGEKIFVYKSNTGITDEEISLIYDAAQSYGKVKLLFVRKSDDAKLIGRAHEIMPNAYVGYLKRFGRNSDGKWDTDYENWLTVCREAAAGLN